MNFLSCHVVLLASYRAKHVKFNMFGCGHTLVCLNVFWSDRIVMESGTIWLTMQKRNKIEKRFQCGIKRHSVPPKSSGFLPLQLKLLYHHGWYEVMSAQSHPVSRWHTYATLTVYIRKLLWFNLLKATMIGKADLITRPLEKIHKNRLYNGSSLCYFLSSNAMYVY